MTVKKLGEASEQIVTLTEHKGAELTLMHALRHYKNLYVHDQATENRPGFRTALLKTDLHIEGRFPYEKPVTGKWCPGPFWEVQQVYVLGQAGIWLTLAANPSTPSPHPHSRFL